MMWSIFSLFLLSFVFKSDHKISLDDTIFIKVYVMMYWMFCNVWSISPCFDIPDMFFLTSFKTLASFVYTTPIKFSTRYFTFGWCWICGLNLREGNSCCKFLKSLFTIQCSASQQLSLVCYFQHLKAQNIQTTHTCHFHTWRTGLHVF